MKNMTRKRLPRDRRLPPNERPPMQLTDRDQEIVRAVNDHRALTAAHIADLFGMSSSPVQRRLQLLFHHEYLDRQIVTVLNRSSMNMPDIYTLGRRGVRLLIDAFAYEQNEVYRPRRQFAWDTIDHLLRINNFRVAVAIAARARDWTLETWHDERFFRAHPDKVTLIDRNGKESEKPVLPDGYFCLAVPQGRAHFFLEIDRGTEPRSAFRPQIRVYEQYVASGGYQARYSQSSLSILVVTTTQPRIDTLKGVTKKAGGDHKYWFTTFEQATSDQVLTEPIWQRLEGVTPYPLIDPV